MCFQVRNALVNFFFKLKYQKKTLDKNIATERSRKKNNKELCSFDQPKRLDLAH